MLVVVTLKDVLENIRIIFVGQPLGESLERQDHRRLHSPTDSSRYTDIYVVYLTIDDTDVMASW